MSLVCECVHEAKMVSHAHKMQCAVLKCVYRYHREKLLCAAC